MKGRFLLLAALQLFTGIVTFGLHGLLGRAIGPSNYAIFGVFWNATLLVSQVLFIAVQYGVTKNMADYRAHGKRPIEVVRTVAIVTAGLIVIFIPVALVASPFLLGLFSGKASVLIAFILTISFYGASYIARGTVVGLSMFRVLGVIIAIEATVRLLAALIGYYGLDGKLNAMTYSVAIGAATSLIALPVILKITWPQLTSGEPQTLPLSHALNIAIPTFIVTGSEQVILNTPNLLAKTVGGASVNTPAVIGAFSAAILFSRIPQYIIAPITSTLLSDFTSSAARQDNAHFRRQLLFAGAAFVSLAIIMAAGFWLLGPFVYHIMYGNKFSIGASHLAILAAGVGIFVLADVLNVAMVGRGRASLSAACWVVGVAGYLATVFLFGTNSLYSYEVGVLVGVLITASMLWFAHFRLLRTGSQQLLHSTAAH